MKRCRKIFMSMLFRSVLLRHESTRPSMSEKPVGQENLTFRRLTEWVQNPFAKWHCIKIELNTKHRGFDANSPFSSNIVGLALAVRPKTGPIQAKNTTF
jgi:hypothetical protein